MKKVNKTLFIKPEKPTQKVKCILKILPILLKYSSYQNRYQKEVIGNFFVISKNFQIISESTCAKRKNADIETLILSNNCDKKSFNLIE